MIATESDMIRKARGGRTLADMLAGDIGRRYSDIVADEAVTEAVEDVPTEAEVVEEAEAITTAAAVITCTHTGCLNAIGDHADCECACGGIGHGAATVVRQAAARTKADKTTTKVYGDQANSIRVGGGMFDATFDEGW